MKFMIFGGLALATALAAAPASAQTFEGPYVGVQGGWNHDSVGAPDTDLGKTTINRSRDSFTGGVYAGYDHQIVPRVVIGVEGSFDFTTSDNVRGTGGRIDPRFSFDLGARAGYVVADKTLLYVRGGYKNLQANVIRTNGTTTLRDRDTFDGWSIGGGVERLITDHVSARVEYRYSDLGNKGGKYERQQALVGVAYRF